MQLRFSCRSFLLAIRCSLVVPQSHLRETVSMQRQNDSQAKPTENMKLMTHCIILYINQLLLVCSLLCFLLRLLSVSLHPKKNFFVESACVLYYCFLAFCRTGQYISPELFYFVNIASSCSLFPCIMQGIEDRVRQRCIAVSGTEWQFVQQCQHSCMAVWQYRIQLCGSVKYSMAVCIAVSAQLYGSIGYSCMAVSGTAVWQCQVQLYGIVYSNVSTAVWQYRIQLYDSAKYS